MADAVVTTFGSDSGRIVIFPPLPEPPGSGGGGSGGGPLHQLETSKGHGLVLRYEETVQLVPQSRSQPLTQVTNHGIVLKNHTAVDVTPPSPPLSIQMGEDYTNNP